MLLGADGESSCADLPRGADCLPSEVDHNGGDIEFARDGTMFVSTGDGGGKDEFEATALTSQARHALGGKVLRITRDGRGVRGNPFWNGDPDANRSKIWALGLRNPFRMALHPETGHALCGRRRLEARRGGERGPAGREPRLALLRGVPPQPTYRTAPGVPAPVAGASRAPCQAARCGGRSNSRASSLVIVRAARPRASTPS